MRSTKPTEERRSCRTCKRCAGIQSAPGPERSIGKSGRPTRHWPDQFPGPCRSLREVVHLLRPCWIAWGHLEVFVHHWWSQSRKTSSRSHSMNAYAITVNRKRKRTLRFNDRWQCNVGQKVMSFLTNRLSVECMCASLLSSTAGQEKQKRDAVESKSLLAAWRDAGSPPPSQLSKHYRSVSDHRIQGCHPKTTNSNSAHLLSSSTGMIAPGRGRGVRKRLMCPNANAWQCDTWMTSAIVRFDVGRRKLSSCRTNYDLK